MFKSKKDEAPAVTMKKLTTGKTAENASNQNGASDIQKEMSKSGNIPLGKVEPIKLDPNAKNLDLIASQKAAEQAGLLERMKKRQIDAFQNAMALQSKKPTKLGKAMFDSWEDAEYMDDVRQATLRGAHPISNMLFWFFFLFFVVLIFWLNVATVPEVTRGMGKVVPSSKVQVLQNLEGGTIDDILVHEGDVVEKDQVLVKIDDTGYASSQGEKMARVYATKASIARLIAVSTESKPVWPADVMANSPSSIEAENALYLSTMEELQSNLEILKRQVEQRKQELNESQARVSQAQRNYELSNEEYKITAPLASSGSISKIELLDLKRKISNALAERDAGKTNVDKAKSALKEANRRVEERTLRSKNEAQIDLAKKRQELASIIQLLKGDTDRVSRAEIRSPMKGTVSKLFVHTIGGVIKPGMDVVEVVPMEDSMLVEAKINPKDIAFLRPGQKATVKITAYDFSIYGGLDGKLEFISGDTTTDDKGNTFYIVRIRTDKNYLGTKEKPLPIMPGMIASADVISGQKTIMEYLIKPFNKVKEQALREH